MIPTWRERIDDPTSPTTVFDAMKAEIDDLRTENESLRAECGVRQIAGYNKGKAKSAAEIEALRKDAEQYRCIRKGAWVNQSSIDSWYWCTEISATEGRESPEDFDADVAFAARGQGEG